ncbi:hypothetical protein C8R46DRAFT_1223330 [Mycena filopes]|nr:hypothetical protein C8R46DRAFT_1223330 [Mycena filopes]
MRPRCSNHSSRSRGSSQTTHGDRRCRFFWNTDLHSVSLAWVASVYLGPVPPALVFRLHGALDFVSLSSSLDQYASAQESFVDLHEASFTRGTSRAFVNSSSSRAWSSRKAFVTSSALLARQEQVCRLQQRRFLSAQAITPEAAQDYIHSSWEDNRLHNYLVEKGVLAKDAADKKPAELLGCREWLIAHDIVGPGAPLPQIDVLKAKMSQYYSNAWETIWEAWSEPDARSACGTRRRSARSKLVKMMQANFDDIATSAAYLIWPNARLHPYLRNHGLAETALPTSRPGRLQETRIRWIQTQTPSEHVREAAVETTEETLASILNVLAGEAKNGADSANKQAEEGKKQA